MSPQGLDARFPPSRGRLPRSGSVIRPGNSSASAGDSSSIVSSPPLCRGLLALMAGVLFSAFSALGTELAYFKTVTNTDYLVAGVGGMRDVGRGKILLSGLTGEVSQAYLYWNGVVADTNENEIHLVQVNGLKVEGRNIGLSLAPCWPGYQWSQTFRADVTSLVAHRGDGIYSLTGFLKSGKINADGASLLVFYDDSDPNNNRDVVLYDGNDLNLPNSYDSDGFSLIATNQVRYAQGQAFLQLHVADGQVIPNFDDGEIILNDRTLVPGRRLFSGDTVPGENNGPEGNGNLWDIKSWEITGFLQPGFNNLILKSSFIPTGDCLCLLLAVIDLPAFPVLQIAAEDGSNLAITWPGSVTQFLLQSSTDISVSNRWINVQEQPMLASNRFRVNVPIEAGSRFFRLIKP